MLTVGTSGRFPTEREGRPNVQSARTRTSTEPRKNEVVAVEGEEAAPVGKVAAPEKERADNADEGVAVLRCNADSGAGCPSPG